MSLPLPWAHHRFSLALIRAVLRFLLLHCAESTPLELHPGATSSCFQQDLDPFCPTPKSYSSCFIQHFFSQVRSCSVCPVLKLVKIGEDKLLNDRGIRTPELIYKMSGRKRFPKSHTLAWQALVVMLPAWLVTPARFPSGPGWQNDSLMFIVSPSRWCGPSPQALEGCCDPWVGEEIKVNSGTFVPLENPYKSSPWTEQQGRSDQINWRPPEQRCLRHSSSSEQQTSWTGLPSLTHRPSV